MEKFKEKKNLFFYSFFQIQIFFNSLLCWSLLRFKLELFVTMDLNLEKIRF